MELDASLEWGLLTNHELSAHRAVTMIHGGAGPISKDMERSHGAYLAGKATLERLRLMIYEDPIAHCAAIYGIDLPTTLTAAELQVVTAVTQLEASPFFNAGRGAALQRDGVCRVTAAFMESQRRRLSGVINAQGVIHPSILALVLQGEKHGLLDAEGANLLMRRLGVPFEDAVTPHQFGVWSQKRLNEMDGVPPSAGETGTVGSVSCDAAGNLAVVTSTGGVGFESIGRVGDVPSVAGTYCSNTTAVSCTGYGEQIVAHALAARIVVRLEDAQCAIVDGVAETVVAALRKSLNEAVQQNFQFAFICLHRMERAVIWARGATTPRFAWGVVWGSNEQFHNN